MACLYNLMSRSSMNRMECLKFIKVLDSHKMLTHHRATAYHLSNNIAYWDPALLFHSESRYACLALNNFLERSEDGERMFISLWNNASLKISVDGASNKLSVIKHASAPDIICGDFDSIKPETLSFYKKLSNVKVIETPDQNYTDFAKSLHSLTDYLPNLEYIVAFYSNSARLDHFLSEIKTIHDWFAANYDKPIFLVDLLGSISWILSEKPKHFIKSHSVEWCSLVSFLGCAKLSTSGLLYDMNDTELSFGPNCIQSTSNGMKTSKKFVEIETSAPVMWSQSISDDFLLKVS